MTDYIILDGVSIVHDMDREEAETYNAHLYNMYNLYKDNPEEYLSYGTLLTVSRENIGDIWGYRVIPRSRYGTKYYEYAYELQPIKNGELFGNNKAHISVLGRFSNIRNLRIEWNPDKLPYEFMNFLKDEFESCSQNPFAENRSITSLDLAIDYHDKLFSDYVFKVKYARQEKQWKSIEDNIKQSIRFNSYIGCHFNLYNKAIEQGITDHDWLRLEYSYNSISITPEELLYMPNPFYEVICYVCIYRA